MWTWPIQNGKTVQLLDAKHFTDTLWWKLFGEKLIYRCTRITFWWLQIYFNDVKPSKGLTDNTLYLTDISDKLTGTKMYRSTREYLIWYFDFDAFILDGVSGFLNQELDPINSLWRVVSLASIHRPCNARRNRSDTFCDFIKFNR